MNERRKVVGETHIEKEREREREREKNTSNIPTIKLFFFFFVIHIITTTGFFFHSSCMLCPNGSEKNAMTSTMTQKSLDIDRGINMCRHVILLRTIITFYC